jgi:hypothetical protein
MGSIIDLLNTNKEWLFSGIGTSTIIEIFAIIGGIIYYLVYRLLKKNNAEPNQTLIIGNNSSNNNQAGRDIKGK